MVGKADDKQDLPLWPSTPRCLAQSPTLIDLGARKIDVGQASDATWTVLADPEGNEFCVLSRTVRDVAATE